MLHFLYLLFISPHLDYTFSPSPLTPFREVSWNIFSKLFFFFLIAFRLHQNKELLFTYLSFFLGFRHLLYNRARYILRALRVTAGIHQQSAFSRDPMFACYICFHMCFCCLRWRTTPWNLKRHFHWYLLVCDNVSIWWHVWVSCCVRNCLSTLSDVFLWGTRKMHREPQ